MRLINFPWRSYLISPFVMTAIVGGGAYGAGRLAAENSQAPGYVGLATGLIAITLGGTIIFAKFFEFMRELSRDETEAQIRIAAPIEAPKTRMMNSDAILQPFTLVTSDGHRGEFIHFDPQHTTQEQLETLALWVAAGDMRLSVNLYTTRIENRLTWSRDDFRWFLVELGEQGMASCDGYGHYTITYKGKTFMRELARRSGKPLPHFYGTLSRQKSSVNARMHVRTAKNV
jgi:hypothetical protein